MNETRRLDSHPLVSERERRERLIQQVSLVTLGIFIIFTVTYAVASRIVPGLPTVLLLWGLVGVAWMSGVFWLVRRKHFNLAVGCCLTGGSVIFFVVMHYLGGATGPMALSLIVIPLIAGAMTGRLASLLTLLLNSLLYLTSLVLEYLGLITPYPMPPIVLQIMWGGIFVSVSSILLVLNAQLSLFMQRSITVLGQQQRDLTLATQRAQAAVEAERELRRRDAQAAEQLDSTLKQYVNFLELIRAGDYATRLDMNEMAKDKNMSLSLINLGRYLNATVESLVEALTEVQSVQQAYVQRSWQSLAESGTTPGGYQYREEGVTINNEVWLPSMTQAVRSRKLAVAERELAIPLQTRGQIIGAVGARRDVAQEWSPEELEIVGAVADQLAQTIENLRLLDDTNRRASREQAVGEVTAQIRAEVEIEAVLERALMELGRALNAERGAARLTLTQQQEEGV